MLNRRKRCVDEKQLCLVDLRQLLEIVYVAVTDQFFFFQAEDGIRDYKVTGVQTCALPISTPPTERVGRYQLLEPIGIGPSGAVSRAKVFGVAGFERQFAVKRFHSELTATEIGRASCRERV